MRQYNYCYLSYITSSRIVETYMCMCVSDHFALNPSELYTCCAITKCNTYGRLLLKPTSVSCLE